MRAKVAKEIRRVCARLQKSKDYYRRLKREWHSIPPAKRADVLRAWRETLDIPR